MPYRERVIATVCSMKKDAHRNLRQHYFCYRTSRRFQFPATGSRRSTATTLGKFEVDQRQRTTVGKIFIGGDIANNVADAISAIADGKNAAIGIDDFVSVATSTD